MTERTNFDFLTDEQLLEEIKRLWYEQAAFEYDQGDEWTVADDYLSMDAEKYIDQAEATYRARGLELPDRQEYVRQFEDD